MQCLIILVKSYDKKLDRQLKLNGLIFIEMRYTAVDCTGLKLIPFLYCITRHIIYKKNLEYPIFPLSPTTSSSVWLHYKYFYSSSCCWSH